MIEVRIKKDKDFSAALDDINVFSGSCAIEKNAVPRLLAQYLGKS